MPPKGFKEISGLVHIGNCTLEKLEAIEISCVIELSDYFSWVEEKIGRKLTSEEKEDLEECFKEQVFLKENKHENNRNEKLH